MKQTISAVAQTAAISSASSAMHMFLVVVGLPHNLATGIPETGAKFRYQLSGTRIW